MLDSSPLITVGHVVYAFKNGGIERGILNLINYGDQKQFKHIVFCLTEAGAFSERLQSSTCQVIELHKRPGNDVRLPLRIAMRAQKYGVNVLHARGWPAMVETIVAARLAQVRATVYGFHGKGIPELKGLTLRRRLTQKIVIRAYSRVVTLNRRMQADLAAECGIATDRIHTIANGVDIEAFKPHPDRRAIRERFNLPSNRFIIGNVARLDPVKNHEIILKAMNSALVKRLDALFLLVGDGPHYAMLKRKIEELGLDRNVRLFGYSDCIAELLNCMDVYIQSSFYEGFSNTVLEAMACGVPILATDVGGTGDIMSDGEEGYFFMPTDHEHLVSLVMRLARDCNLRRTLGTKGRRRATIQFPVQAMVRNYENIYSELLAGSNQ